MRRRLGASAPLSAIIILGVALLACKKKEETTSAAPVATVAPKPKPVEPPTPTQTFRLNQPAKLDGLTLTLEDYKECRLDNYYSRAGLSRRKQKLIGALTAFEGNYEQAHQVFTSKFKLTAEDGTAYSSTTRSGSNCSPTLKSNKLAKGEKTRGWILFEVPKDLDEDKLTISYSNRRPYRTGAPLTDREQRAKFDPETSK